MILRFLNWQGIAGIALSLALSILLVIQKTETSHWKKQAGTFEQLYHQEQAAFAETVADVVGHFKSYAPPPLADKWVSGVPSGTE